MTSDNIKKYKQYKCGKFPNKKYNLRYRSDDRCQYYDKSIDIPEINTDEIICVISLLSNSAAGYDGMPASIMKQLVGYFVQPLTFLNNKSIAQGTVPDELKIATVIPIHKNKDEQRIQNYRPISVLPFISKKN